MTRKRKIAWFLRPPGWSVLAVCLCLAGCEKNMKNMYDQPKNNAESPSRFFSDGTSARPVDPQTVPRSGGALAGTSSGRAGTLDLPQPAPSAASPAGAQPAHAQAGNPYPVTVALIHRGEERFNIYCAPCHSMVGDGDGMVVRRGFPRPPSFHTDRLRQAPDRHFYDVISNGYGIMYAYGDRVEPRDRWAITAYIRALQFSQDAPVSHLPAGDRARLEAAQ